MASVFQASLLLVLAVAVGLPIMRRGGSRFSFDVITVLISAALGLVLLSLVMTFTWSAGVRPEQTIPSVAAIAVVVVAVDIAMATPGKPSAPQEFRLIRWVPSVLIALVYALPVLLSCAWMGAGVAPEVFFNGDTPYYMSHVQSLHRFDVFPPMSLNVQGVTQAYHYGIQLIAALFSRLSDVPAHTAMFWIAIPILLVGKVAAVWRIATIAADRGMPHWLGLLCLLFFLPYPISSIYDKIPYLLLEPSKVIGNVVDAFFVVQRFDTGFAMPGIQAASFLVYLAGLLMVDCSRPRRWFGIAIAVGCLPLFKAAYIVPVGIWVGIWALYHLIRDRQLAPLLTAFGAAVLALAVSRLSVRTGFSFSIVFDPLSQDAMWRKEMWQALLDYGGLIIFAGACMGAVWRASARSTAAWLGDGWVFLLTTVILLFVPMLVTAKYVDPYGDTLIYPFTIQWFHPLKYIVPIALTIAVARSWPEIAFARKVAFGAAIALLTAFPVVTKARDTAALFVEPESGHDFADNRQILPALAAIPVTGSLVMTNDVHNPANNYIRDHRNFQIAALFGHQAYAAGMYYDPPPDIAARTNEIMLLRQQVWSEEMTKIACTRGWTHVLLSKRLPRVEHVPGTLLYDSPYFSTYALPPCK